MILSTTILIQQDEKRKNNSLIHPSQKLNDKLLRYLSVNGFLPKQIAETTLSKENILVK